jgi:hypothetical protein
VRSPPFGVFVPRETSTVTELSSRPMALSGRPGLFDQPSKDAGRLPLVASGPQTAVRDERP